MPAFIAFIPFRSRNNLMQRDEYPDMSDEQYVAFSSEFEDGDTVPIDDNYCECESYTIGSNRCDCGNRRVVVEPDIYNGEIFFRFEVY